MPPEAISRSSMYLPKICGNILRRHPSALWSALLLLSCSPDPVAGPEMVVVAYQLDQCELPPGNARIELEALGDFDPSNRTTDSLSSDARGTSLSFPANTLGVRATLTADRSSERFVALGQSRRGDAVPLLLWPEGRTCALSSADADYPAAQGGQGIGYSEALGLVLIAGSDRDTSGAVSGAMSFDVATGEVVVLPPGPRQMSRARAFATVTPFGRGFLVAGGEDPTVTFDSGRRNLRRTAELYDPVAGEFSDDLVELVNPRSRHRAVVLPNGDTALIGGVTEASDGERTALAPIEVISVATRTTSDGPRLARARIDPTVLKLSDGRFFVAGGETLDGELVTSVEWRSDELREDAVEDFSARFDQAFVPMPGGAVLAVGGCEDREGDPAECAVCQRGCPPQDGWDAFWIDEEGHVVRFLVDVPVPQPLLIPASDGSPFLVTTTDQDPLLLRFDPWARSFFEVQAGEAPLPSRERPSLSLDAGAYVYVADVGDRAQFWGRRFSTRNPFSQDSELVRVTHSTSSAWPLHLAPGGAGESSVGLTPRDDPTLPWVLKLGDGSVWVTDTAYADFELELELAGGAAPRLRLGSATCAWPAESATGERTLTAKRHQDEVTLGAGGASKTCDVQAGRVRLGFDAPRRADPPAELLRITLRRGAP